VLISTGNGNLGSYSEAAIAIFKIGLETGQHRWYWPKPLVKSEVSRNFERLFMLNYMTQMPIPRPELVRQSERQMARLVGWIALSYFALALVIASFA
jgi:hypothetical protein